MSGISATLPTASANARHDFAAGLHRLADPKITLASISSIFLATGAAAATGPIDPLWLGMTLLGIFGVEVGKNASGEIYDWDSGCDRSVEEKDRSPFSGGKRVLVDGLLDRRETRFVATCFYALALACGALIALFREPRVIPFALAGFLLAFGYHAPPLAFSYRGLGEAAVALAYGPGIACGTYLVLTGRIDRPVFLASLPLGLLIAAFLVINEVPDAPADAKARKRNLVSRFGRSASPAIYASIVASAFLLLSALPALGLPPLVLLGGAALVPAAMAAARLSSGPDDIPRLVPAQAATLASFVVYAAAVGTAFLVSSR